VALTVLAPLVACFAWPPAAHSAAPLLEEVLAAVISVARAPLHLLALGLLVLVVVVATSRVGRLRLGGPSARPRASSWLVASAAWAVLGGGVQLLPLGGDTLLHIAHPPDGVDPTTPSSGLLALATLLLRDALFPFALLAVPALVIAFAHQHLGHGASPGAALLRDRGAPAFLARLVDGAALVGGTIAASSILARAGSLVAEGLHRFGVAGSRVELGASLVVVMGFGALAVALLGAWRGGLRAADVSGKILLLVVVCALVAGPTGNVLASGTAAVGVFLETLPRRSLATGLSPLELWPSVLTTLRWLAAWAMAPAAAVLVARLGRGRTLRDLAWLLVGAPALLTTACVVVIGGLSVSFEVDAPAPTGVVATIAILRTLPGGDLWAPLFIGACLLAAVATAALHTEALASIGAARRPSAQARIAAAATTMWLATLSILVDRPALLEHATALAGLLCAVVVGGFGLALVRMVRAPERAAGERVVLHARRAPVSRPEDLRFDVTFDFAPTRMPRAPLRTRKLP
jgi:choline-glycine betaine transporter